MTTLREVRNDNANRFVILLSVLVVASPSQSSAGPSLSRSAPSHESDIALLQQTMKPLDEFDRAWKAYGRCAPDKGTGAYATCGRFLEQAEAAAKRLAALAGRAPVSPDFSAVQVKLVAVAQAWSSGTAEYLMALKSGDSSLLAMAAAKAEAAVKLKNELNAELTRANERYQHKQHLDVIQGLVMAKGMPESRACHRFSKTTDDACRRVLAADEDPRLRTWSVIELVCQSFDERVGPACRRRAFAEYVGSGTDAGTACMSVARWAGDMYQESCSWIGDVGAKSEHASLRDACARTRRSVEARLREKCEQ